MTDSAPPLPRSLASRVERVRRTVTARRAAVPHLGTRDTSPARRRVAHRPGPHIAEPDGQERLFGVPREKSRPDRHPCATVVFRMLAHGPSHRALNRPTPGGAR
ncbi:hypothetical protein [Streptomyces sp. NPDC021356]|uniref:hypothetical protein n=1 Tax=Streptomyces sp. NPDC021356 TaxID=3154900 RepID=UPI0033C3576C